jgi:hypothetical protein
LSLLASVVDAVSHLTSVLIAVNSDDGKVPESPRVPRPVIALDRVREQERWRRREAFIAQVLPDRSSTGTTPE